MCGIFGYAGPDVNHEVLIEGIKRLEYRGYDSWGVCVAMDDQLAMLRRVGRIGGVNPAEMALGSQGTIDPAGVVSVQGFQLKWTVALVELPLHMPPGHPEASEGPIEQTIRAAGFK